MSKASDIFNALPKETRVAVSPLLLDYQIRTIDREIEELRLHIVRRRKHKERLSKERDAILETL